MATETAPPRADADPATSDGHDGASGAETASRRTPSPPQVDVEALTRWLDGRYVEVRRLVREQLVEHASVLEDQESMSTEAFRDRVRDVLVEMAGTGQTGLGFPEEYGGGGDVGASVAAFETLAQGDLSVLVKAGVQFGLFGGAILQLGTKRHHDAYLPDLIAARTLGCFAMTETGHGSNVQALGTVATYDTAAGEFEISSTRPDAWKDYIGNAAAHGTVAVVFAQLEVGGESHGVHAFVVPVRGDDGAPLPGVRIQDDGPKMGLKGVDNGRLWFDGVRVPREALLNRFADVTPTGVYESEIDNPNRRFFTTLGTLVQGRVCVGGAGINASKVAITIAVRYALLRRQFEAQDPDTEQLLLDYGQHQRRLLPLLADTYALHLEQEAVAAELHEIFSVAGGQEDAAQGAEGGEEVDEGEREQRRRRLEARAAGTKAYGTWHATRTIQEGREACGGAGYLSVNRFAALKADSDIFTTFEGDNHVLLQLVAKGLLTDYASEFEDMDQLDMARFVAGLAVETVLEKTNARKLVERLRDLIPAAPGGETDPEAGLLDSDYQLAMLRFREEHMLGGVARRLKSGIDRGMNPGLVFSRVQDHVIAAARAHVERQVLETFVAKVRAMPEGGNRDAVALLLDLHALTTIERDRAWFMEHDRLTVQRSKAITREVNRLCRRLRPIARELVDALAVPEPMLRAPELIGTVAPGSEPRIEVR